MEGSLLMTDTNLTTGVTNAYTMSPYLLIEEAKKVGQLQMLFTIKAIVTVLDDKAYYKLYRCGWNGTPNSDQSLNDHGVPQGLPLLGTANEIQEVARVIFSVLVRSGAIPDLFEYGELEKIKDESET